MRRLALVVICICVVVSHHAAAWGPEGHQSVGAIADQLIAGTTTAKEVRKILGSTLKTASVWPDCARGVAHNQQTGTFKYHVNPKFAECQIYETAAGQRLMEDFVRRNFDNCHPGPQEEECHKQYHYTDVATSHDHYELGFMGTSDHDIVGAMGAAIAVLEDRSPTNSINIKNKREALRLLTHYVGDVHQPLHVVAVYLDADGNVVDPDGGAFDPGSATKGGNLLLDGGNKLHGEWDDAPASVHVDHLNNAIFDAARAVPKTPGALDGWPEAWASDTISVGGVAFLGVTASAEQVTPKGHTWRVTLPAGYSATRSALQHDQVIKAGARLAQLLTELFP